MTTFYKYPSDNLDYTIDWTADLGAENIVTSTWTIPSPLVGSAQTNTTKKATTWISGGDLGASYLIINTITTSGGHTYSQPFTLIADAEPTPTDLTKLTTTRDDIIRLALEDCKAYAPDFQDPSSGMMSRCAMRLNAMIKAWQAAGVGLWLNQECFLPLKSGAQSYELGPTGDKCCRSTDMVETTISTAAASGATHIHVTSSTGFYVAYNVGIELDDGTIQWVFATNTATPGTVYIDTALTDTAAVGNVVYTFDTTAQIGRPIGINEARIVDTSHNEISLYICSRDDYMALPLKNSTGKPVQIYFDAVLTNSVVRVWPVDTTISDRILFTARLPIQCFQTIPSNPDFPDESVDALHYGLAVRISPMFDVSPDLYNKLKELAAITLQDFNQADREMAPVTFAPAFGPGRG